MAKGRKLLAKEIDIVNVLKQLRAIQTIIDMKLKLSSHQTEQVAKTRRINLRLTSDSDSENSPTGKSGIVNLYGTQPFDPSKTKEEEIEMKTLASNLTNIHDAQRAK